MPVEERWARNSDGTRASRYHGWLKPYRGLGASVSLFASFRTSAPPRLGVVYLPPSVPRRLRAAVSSCDLVTRFGVVPPCLAPGCAEGATGGAAPRSDP